MIDIGVKFNKITPYRPQSNGLVERSNRKIKLEMQLRKVEDPVWDLELPSVQLGLNLTRLSDGTSPFLRLHGWLLFRPAFLETDFDENAHTRQVLSEGPWIKENIRRMRHIIAQQYVTEETRKSATKMDTVQAQNLTIGDKCLIYFPNTNESKLFTPWKGIYEIVEKLDRNVFVVRELEQTRKKYIVHRARIRKLEDPVGSNENTAVSQPSVEKCQDSDVDSAVDVENEPVNCELEDHNRPTTSPPRSSATINSRPKRLARHKANKKIQEWTKKLRK